MSRTHSITEYNMQYPVSEEYELLLSTMESTLTSKASKRA